ncbi:T-complex protein 1 subunit beta [Marasmius crinis-equi]|uniref:T-complex protein 1 subunit beta n=1 Tax=Marasmius crinis-equi TaxID=585013 RepID=A0ABR3EVH2_9AGAR
MRAAHCEGEEDAGLDMNEAAIASRRKLDIIECYHSKRQVALSVIEAAKVFIRVDDILGATPWKCEAV